MKWIFLLVSVSFLVPVSLFASPAHFGGYDLEKVAGATVSVLQTKGVVSGLEAAGLRKVFDLGDSSDPLVVGPSVVNFYDHLGSLLLERGVISQPEIDTARKTATESGGIKVGGMNPVVLAASYLDIFIRKGIVSLESAQSILDGAKR